MLDGHRAERDTCPSFQIMYLKSGELTLCTNTISTNLLADAQLACRCAGVTLTGATMTFKW